jgi:hypothetical protein
MALPSAIVITEAQMHEALRQWIQNEVDRNYSWGGIEVTKVQRYEDMKSLSVVRWCIDVEEKTA